MTDIVQRIARWRDSGVGMVMDLLPEAQVELIRLRAERDLFAKQIAAFRTFLTERGCGGVGDANGMHDLAQHHEELIADNERQAARIARLEAALRFYRWQEPTGASLREAGRVAAAALADAPEEKPSANVLDAILTSDIDEALMRSTLLRCYGARHHGFHMSVEHYRYLAEQIIALRVHIKRAAPAALADATGEKL